MNVMVEKDRLNDVLKWEQDNHYSREKIVILAGEDLPMGGVVGQVTASGKIVKIDYAASDGSQVAYGFLIADYDASLADVEGAAIVRDALIDPGYLAWPMAFTGGGTDVPRVGDVIAGATSGHTGEIVKIEVTSGSWAAGDAAGVLWLRKVSGEFQAENLDIAAREITDFASIAAGLTVTVNLALMKDEGIIEREGV
jgi:hypothetical protein